MKQVLNSVKGDLDNMKKAKKLVRERQNFIFQHGNHDVMVASKANEQLVVFLTKSHFQHVLISLPTYLILVWSGVV